MTHPLQEHWQHLDGEIRGAMASVHAFWGRKHIEEIELYLDHNEYGEAFTYLVGALDQMSAPLPRVVYDRLIAISKKLERDINLVERLGRVVGR